MGNINTDQKAINQLNKYHLYLATIFPYLQSTNEKLKKCNLIYNEMCDKQFKKFGYGNIVADPQAESILV